MGSSSTAGGATIPEVQPETADATTPTELERILLTDDPTNWGINLGLLNGVVCVSRASQEDLLPGHPSTDGAPPTAPAAPDPLDDAAGINWAAEATDTPASVGAGL